MRAISKERLARIVLLAFAALYYSFLLTGGDFALWGPGKGLELTFNSMLEHLLKGEFDVDPSTVGDEGFARDGSTYAYWGIFLALIRLPLLLVPGGLGLDVEPLSCLIAVWLSAYVKLRTLGLVFRDTERTPVRSLVFWALALSIVFAGPQIEFLKASLYQEVCLWAGTLAAVFVYCAVRGISEARFAVPVLCCMALTAGLVLLTRVSVGVGLYAALGLLLVSIVISETISAHGEAKGNMVIARFVSHALSPRCLLPGVILVAFAALAGLVNFYRWGDPLVFANYDTYIANKFYLDRLPRTEAYGLFNLSRVPFGLIYYLFPIWMLRRGDGQLLFEEDQTRLIDSAELPPSSFLLTDPLLVLLTGFLCWTLASKRVVAEINKVHTLALLAGLAAPCLLMLSAISMTFRYRIDFYPFLEFGAFVGCLILCKVNWNRWSFSRVRAWCVAGTLVGISASELVLFLYKLSPFGPANTYLRDGVFTYYGSQIASHLPWLRWLFH